MKKGISGLLIIIPALLLISGKKGPVTVTLTAKDLEQVLVLVPGQLLDTRYCDSCHDVKIDSFYVSCYEMNNGFYNYYLTSLRYIEKDTAAYLAALPDTTVWRMKMAYNEPYVKYYLHHPAYRDYPVVGVSWEQANAFCAWLTRTYNAMPKRKYKNVRFDLPTKYEWWAAAAGGLRLCPYPWGGPYLRNSQGQTLANYKHIDEGAIRRDTICGGTPVYMVHEYGGDPMGTAGMLNDAADITAPVYSYWPNDYGLYTMSGNVEEMVKEKGISKGGSWRDTGYYLRLTSEEQYSDTSGSAERGFRFIMRLHAQ